MRRVILFVATSLDGFLAGPEGEVDWLFSDQDYGMARFFRSVDTVLVGGNTYRFMLQHGLASYKGMRNVVFSRGLDSAAHPEVEIVSGDPEPIVESLRRGNGKDIWLVGGGRLNRCLLERGLVDEVVVSVHPVILGRGISVYEDGAVPVNLDLIKLESFDTGLVQITYRVQRAGEADSQPGAEKE